VKLPAHRAGLAGHLPVTSQVSISNYGSHKKYVSDCPHPRED